MRAASPSTIAWIDELYRLASVRAGLWTGRAHASGITSLLRQIASSGEPLAIPRIVSLTLDRRREIAEAAGQTVETLLRLVNVRDLGAFARAFRGLYPSRPPEAARWVNMGPADVRTLAGLETGPALLQVAMCHPNGYVREEAIRRSATCADGAELPFLLLRTNDWVKPVRDLAQAALCARLTPEHVPELVNALPMLDAMRQWGRMGTAPILDAIEQLLRRPEADAGLRTASRSPDRFTRRGAYRRLFERARLEPSPGARGASETQGPYRTAAPSPRSNGELFATAMRDRDPAIRAWAGQWLLEADGAVFASFADQLLRDRLGSLRLGAARRLLAAGAQLPWRELLLDPSAAVRALAQTAALDAGGDPDREYRDLLASSRGTRLGAALVGLSETGGPSDAELVRGYLRDQTPVVRRSALHALAKLDAEDLVQRALAALRDANPTVTRAARDLLLARIASVRGDDAWAAFSTAPTSEGKRAALAVLARLGLWDSLPYLLRAFDAGDEALRPRVLQHVVGWLRHQARSFVSPTPAVASEVSQLIGRSGLPERVRRELAEIIDARAR